jgi:hypothetical protein
MEVEATYEPEKISIANAQCFEIGIVKLEDSLPNRGQLQPLFLQVQTFEFGDHAKVEIT